MGINDDLYSVQLPDGRTFTCSRLVLQKTGGKCPVYHDVVDAEIAAKHESRAAAKAAKGGF